MNQLIRIPNIPTRWSAIRKITLEIIVILLLFLFLGTAVSKWVDHENFRDSLRKSPFLISYAGVLSHVVPLAETLTVVMLLFKRTLLWGFYSSVFLMTAFTSYIYMLLHYSYYLPCRCHAALESLTWEQHLLFNLAFLVLAIAGAVLASNPTVYNSTKMS